MSVVRITASINPGLSLAWKLVGDVYESVI